MSVIAEWNGLKWEVSPKMIRGITSLSTSCKLKSTQDEEGKNQPRGRELQPLSIEYEAGIGAGVNPESEYERLEGMVGQTSPFLLGGRLFGPPLFQLDSVSMTDLELDVQGRILHAKFSLSFTEYGDEAAGGKTQERIQVLYNGTDIYNDISINECVHDMYASSQSDELLLRFNDTRHLWDGWSPENEETIEVVSGPDRTGKMFIESVTPENGVMTLRAFSIPPSAKDRHSKAWENVKLVQIGQEIASRCGLGFEQYEVEDQLYEYARQDDQPDFAFLEERCALEGVAFLVFDGTLVLYSEAAMESKAPLKTVSAAPDAQYEYTDNAMNAYGKAEIVNGSITGTFTTPSGSSKLLHKVLSLHLSGSGEADRFAKGLLRYENKGMTTGTLAGPIRHGLAAGSTVSMKTEGAASWDGAAFLFHVRNDYANETSKLWFRKPLEGY